MVRTFNGLDVVPNRNLKDYLLSEVPKRANAKSIKIEQQPETIVECGEATYIGRVRRAGPGSTPADAQPTLSNLVDVELARTGAGFLRPSARTLPSSEVARLDIETGFGAARKTILNAKAPSHFETRTGLSVNGAIVARAFGTPNMPLELLTQGDGKQQPALIRLLPTNSSAGSVVLMFEDGSGTVVAGLAGYIGTVTIDSARVTNVSYIPSQNSGKWDAATHSRLLELRAVVATAARFGEFRIEGNRDGRSRTSARLADQIRALKGVDPTLGLYAAYAYAEAGIIEQVRSVRDYMYQDLGADLFDVALLAGRLTGRKSDDQNRPVPFCPMLSQGWSLLRVKGVRLPPEIERSRDDLRPSLWTTFGPVGMRIISGAVRGGILR